MRTEPIAAMRFAIEPYIGGNRNTKIENLFPFWRYLRRNWKGFSAFLVRNR
jgi:hypothetical protein